MVTAIPIAKKVEQTQEAIKARINRLADVNFSERDLTTTENVTDVTVGPKTHYNEAYGHSWILHRSGQSFIEITFNLSAEQAAEANILKLNHLSSLVRGQGFSPVDISVNDTMVREHYSPEYGTWCYERFPVEKGVFHEGANKIRISLRQDARTNYWVNAVSVDSVENPVYSRRVEW